MLPPGATTISTGMSAVTPASRWTGHGIPTPEIAPHKGEALREHAVHVNDDLDAARDEVRLD